MMTNKIALHISLDANDPVWQWVAQQADRVEATGHVGTHFDAYTKEPNESEIHCKATILRVPDVLTDEMIVQLPELKNEALILWTKNINQHPYGSPDYFSHTIGLTKERLTKLLVKKPSFILIDSHGIGRPGREHISFDRQAEGQGCHIIENIQLPEDVQQNVNLRISLDLAIASTGKPAQVYWIKR